MISLKGIETIEKFLFLILALVYVLIFIFFSLFNIFFLPDIFPWIQSSSKSDNMMRLYELDDNPDRRLFLDKLLHYMEERGTPLTQCPTISKQPLDLYRLYHYTKDRGGYLEVTIIIFYEYCS